MEGFHEPLQHDLRDEDLADWHTVNFCIEKLSTEHEKPFFLACGLHKPHLPFAVPRKYYDQFPLAEIELPPYQEDDLNDVPVAGLKMARPEGIIGSSKRTAAGKLLFSRISRRSLTRT
ncbi:MAG: hypothetical protein R3B91_15200 [Planctomycetaceae bacterium]